MENGELSYALYIRFSAPGNELGWKGNLISYIGEFIFP